MKRFVTIIAAGAILSASLVAGLAASDAKHTAPASATQTSTSAPKVITVEAPAKGDTGCRDAAWPYRSVLCAGQDGAAPRKVRVIAANGTAPAVPALR